MFRTHLVNKSKVSSGGKGLIGAAAEVTLPKITNLVETLEGAGVSGKMDVSVIGLIENMELELSFDSLCNDIFSIMDPIESENITINGAIQGMDIGTRKAGFVDLSVIVAGQAKEFNPGVVKAGGKMGSSVTMTLDYYKLILDGKTMVEIDRMGDVFTINGKDVLRAVRGMC